ncbi:YihY/virulence factor BrkB family protein [Anaerotignum faecicola]|nr:YihY/virulence factor BrkB family protein [Anaerotignum faecicola]
MVIEKTVFFIREIIKRYFKDKVGDSAAALTYYFIFSFFPIVIMGSTLLGYADISTAELSNMLSGILPKDVIKIVNQYIIYVTLYKSKNLLMVSIFFTVYFPLRAMSKIMSEINMAYQAESKRPLFGRILLIIVFAMFFAAVFLSSVVMLVVGRRILMYVSEFVNISEEFIDFWVPARFFALAFISFAVITMLYWIAPECKIKLREAVPGAAAAVLGLIFVSWIFSYYVENIGSYSIVFGSIGAIIVLLLWIYLMVTIIIMGAEVNSVLKIIKERNF